MGPRQTNSRIGARGGRTHRRRLDPARPPLASASPSPLVPVIVREVPGSGETAEHLVEAFGGRVGDRLQIISGFAAEIPSAVISTLAADPAVFSVTPDTKVRSEVRQCLVVDRRSSEFELVWWSLERIELVGRLMVIEELVGGELVERLIVECILVRGELVERVVEQQRLVVQVLGRRLQSDGKLLDVPDPVADQPKLRS